LLREEVMRALKLFAISSLLLLATSSCGRSEGEVRSEIARAATCTQASDCAVVGSYCPYGCSIVVNKSEVERIQKLLEANMNNTCLYDCAQLKSIACEGGACVAKFQ
jgi:hypothetical protein